MLEHAAGNEMGAKCSLRRAAGRQLRTFFLDTVLNRRPMVVICVQKRQKVYASEHHAPEKKASPKRGWLFSVSRFRLRVRVLLDLGLGGGETGVKINHLRSRCKHTVNNALKTAVCSCYLYLWFLCLSITKVVNIREESKMALSLFSGSWLVIGLGRCGVTVYSKFPNVAESGLCCIISCLDTVFSLNFQ